TCAAPMVPVAPALFSTTKDCLSCSPSLLATARATESVAPPGGKGTTMVTGLSGQACAAPAATIRVKPVNHLRARWCMCLSCQFYIDGNVTITNDNVTM